jgi:hypothetical protein
MSGMDSEALELLRDGPLAAMFHIACSTSPAARELAREFIAASDAIYEATRGSLGPTVLTTIFNDGLSRANLKKLAEHPPSAKILFGRLQQSFETLQQHYPESLDDYRTLVIMAAEKAAQAVKERHFARSRTTSAERRAIEEIRSFAQTHSSKSRATTPSTSGIAASSAIRAGAMAAYLPSLDCEQCSNLPINS